ncbi:ABC-F family ATP-binding cassette domain-containing protein [Streptomyces chartreusis]|uniref:ABC-F family ATP-binding cassette domain-containing protein n=1 Tax=Streptomyces chartreusis TaxID=1969 RepID=UPI0036BD7B6A
MSLLRAVDLTFSYGAQVVLSDISLSIGEGDRLAVVAPNGTGKSTLLGLLEGGTPDAGSVARIGTVGLLPQERDRASDENIQQYLARRTGVAAAEEAMIRLSEQLADGVPGVDDAYADALERYLSLGGPDLDARAATVGAELGIPEEHDRPIESLSGGQVARLALASIVLARFDVVLLDEPTNDLDLDGLVRLEDHLLGRRGGAVLVSHDREFLHRVSTDVLQLDPHSRTGKVFGGGYDAFVIELERHRQRQEEEYTEYAAKRDSLIERSRESKEWGRAGASRATNAAARAKEPDKNIRYYRQQGAQRTAAKGAALLRSAERLPVVEQPRKEWQLRLRFGAQTRGSDLVATLSGIVVRRGDFRLGPVDLQLSRGDRLAVVGANGTGKSTLLDVLTGRLPCDEGTVSLGEGVVIGEIGQNRGTFDAAASLLGSFSGRTGLSDADTRTLLAKFGLGAEDVRRPASTLSPGERTRADLALLMQEGANLLLLDEPTNHLDQPAIEQLEHALNGYDGSLIVVTHDRRFQANLNVSRTVELAAGRMRSL